MYTELKSPCKELEPLALQKYCEITGHSMEPRTVSHHFSPWAIASLDGLSKMGTNIVEIKCMGARNHAEAMNGYVKPLYNAQMQWQMYVTGLESCDYFVYSPENHRIITVQRDEALISEMVQKGEEFLEMLRTLTAPPLCDKDYIDRSEDIYLEELLKGYKSSSKLAKQYKSLTDDYREKIIQYCQEQSTKCGDYRVTRYLQRGRVEYDKIPELQSVDLEIYRKPLITCYQIS